MGAERRRRRRTNRRSRRRELIDGTRRLLRAIRDEEADLPQLILELSRQRKIFAPLALMLGAFVMLLRGLRLLLTNWRLLLIMVLPAMWIWLAMLDLKLHVLRGHSFHSVKGPVLLPLIALVVAITAAAFFLNATFAFAIAQPGAPVVRRALGEARAHARPVLAWGAGIGLVLAIAVLVAPRWDRPWFALLLGVVVAVMMVCYVAVPARMIGVRPAASRRDKLTASALSSAVGATVSTPPYLLGRVGVLMLGSKPLLIPGIVLLVVGFGLQMGASGAVRAVKLGAALTAGGDVAVEPPDGAGHAKVGG